MTPSGVCAPAILWMISSVTSRCPGTRSLWGGIRAIDREEGERRNLAAYFGDDFFPFDDDAVVVIAVIAIVSEFSQVLDQRVLKACDLFHLISPYGQICDAIL